MTMDIRGHGHSGKQELNMSLRQVAKVARSIIDHLGLDRVTIVGWSMGTRWPNASRARATSSSGSFPDQVGGLQPL